MTAEAGPIRRQRTLSYLKSSFQNNTPTPTEQATMQLPPFTEPQKRLPKKTIPMKNKSWKQQKSNRQIRVMTNNEPRLIQRKLSCPKKSMRQPREVICVANDRVYSFLTPHQENKSKIKCKRCSPINNTPVPS